jgi:hypothetical protein
MVVATHQVTRKCRQITELALAILHYKNAKHLATRNLLTPLRVRSKEIFDLLGGDDRELVWHIMKWPGKEPWSLNI